jgi:opacity protein-like surface antigen
MNKKLLLSFLVASSFATANAKNFDGFGVGGMLGRATQSISATAGDQTGELFSSQDSKKQNFGEIFAIYGKNFNGLYLGGQVSGFINGNGINNNDEFKGMSKQKYAIAARLGYVFKAFDKEHMVYGSAGYTNISQRAYDVKDFNGNDVDRGYRTSKFAPTYAIGFETAITDNVTGRIELARTMMSNARNFLSTDGTVEITGYNTMTMNSVKLGLSYNF